MKLSAVTLQFNRKGNCHYTDRIAWLALNTLCTIGAWQWICQRYHYYVTRYVTEHIRYICIWMSGFVYTNVYSLFIGSHSHRVQAVSCSAVCALYDSLLRMSQLLHVQTGLIYYSINRTTYTWRWLVHFVQHDCYTTMPLYLRIRRECGIITLTYLAKRRRIFMRYSTK